MADADPAGVEVVVLDAADELQAPSPAARATVWRILYHSTTVYGADVAESGT